jgi:hypothetical protein
MTSDPLRPLKQWDAARERDGVARVPTDVGISTRASECSRQRRLSWAVMVGCTGSRAGPRAYAALMRPSNSGIYWRNPPNAQLVRDRGTECTEAETVDVLCRGVAQPGRASGSGPEGRWFESCRPNFTRAFGARHGRSRTATREPRSDLESTTKAHAFQACAFNHSAISPFRINDLQSRLNLGTENCVRPPNVPRSLTTVPSIAAGRQEVIAPVRSTGRDAGARWPNEMLVRRYRSSVTESGSST